MRLALVAIAFVAVAFVAAIGIFDAQRAQDAGGLHREPTDASFDASSADQSSATLNVPRNDSLSGLEDLTARVGVRDAQYEEDEHHPVPTVSGASVHFLAGSTDSEEPSAAEVVANGRALGVTDESSSVSFPFPGEGFLAVSHEDYLPASFFISRRYELAPLADYDVPLQTKWLYGTLLNTHGELVEDAIVGFAEVRRYDRERTRKPKIDSHLATLLSPQTRPDANGRYRLPWPDREHWIFGYHAEHGSDYQLVDSIFDSKEGLLRLGVPRLTLQGATIVGQAVTRAGTPVPRGVVYFDIKGQRSGQVTCGADGRFEIRGVRPGFVTLELVHNARKYAGCRGRIQILSKDEAYEARLLCVEAGSVRHTMQIHTGRFTVDSAVVSLENTEQDHEFIRPIWASAATRPGHSPVVRFSNLIAGFYSVEVVVEIDGGERVRRFQIRVLDDEPSRGQASFGQYLIRGQVPGARGGVRVQLYEDHHAYELWNGEPVNASRIVAETVSASDGSFYFRMLEPFEYTVVASDGPQKFIGEVTCGTPYEQLDVGVTLLAESSYREDE